MWWTKRIDETFFELKNFSTDLFLPSRHFCTFCNRINWGEEGRMRSRKEREWNDWNVWWLRFNFQHSLNLLSSHSIREEKENDLDIFCTVSTTWLSMSLCLQYVRSTACQSSWWVVWSKLLIEVVWFTVVPLILSWFSCNQDSFHNQDFVCWDMKLWWWLEWLKHGQSINCIN